MCAKHYTKGFFEQIRNGSRRSAEVILPLVSELLSVRSVVDVGCGEASWLSVFCELGVEEILGIDGEYVDRELLQIPEDRFRAVDLTKSFKLGRVFDLAMSLEVAEHLPAECASVFVESLCSLAPAVLFSAAIPFQGGNHHVNEQWPDRWASLFRKHGYQPVDFIRKRVWQNGAVDWWYSQNTLLFATENLLESNRELRAEFDQTNVSQLCLIHPRNYLEVVMPSVIGASQLFVDAVRNAVRKRLHSMMSRQPVSHGGSKSSGPPFDDSPNRGVGGSFRRGWRY